MITGEISESNQLWWNVTSLLLNILKGTSHPPIPPPHCVLLELVQQRSAVKLCPPILSVFPCPPHCARLLIHWPPPPLHHSSLIVPQHCLSLPVLHPISLSFITTLSPMSSLLSFYPSLHVFCSLPLFIVPTLLLQFSLILFIGRYLNTDRERINITYLILFIQSFHLSWKMCKFLFQIWLIPAYYFL